MLGPIYSAFGGLSNASKRLQNSAKNLSNMQTPGFKKHQVNTVGIPDVGGNGTVLSGFLEGPNIDMTEKMVDQITTKVAFKVNVNVIKANEEMLGSLLDIKS